MHALGYGLLQERHEYSDLASVLRAAASVDWKQLLGPALKCEVFVGVLHRLYI